MTTATHIGFLIYPNVTLLDAVGPAQVLSRVPGAQVHLIWKTKSPVRNDMGFDVIPTTTFDECPQLDVLCVPGGAGQVPLMGDLEVLGFLKAQAEHAQYITSVCTGSLLLGAAGLLEGYKSACHWAFRNTLKMFAATPVADRVVIDRNRMSGGGVTAGIDFGLTLAAELAGEEVAKTIQLSIEYNPQPPFDAGSPEAAGEAVTARARKALSKNRPG